MQRLILISALSILFCYGVHSGEITPVTTPNSTSTGQSSPDASTETPDIKNKTSVTPTLVQSTEHGPTKTPNDTNTNDGQPAPTIATTEKPSGTNTNVPNVPNTNATDGEPKVTTETTAKSPETTTVSSSPATTPPKAAPIVPPVMPNDKNRFDGPSFFGGIMLSLGLIAIAFLGLRYYRARTERNYHTL